MRSLRDGTVAQVCAQARRIDEREFDFSETVVL
jgi:hypothetical protein